MTPAHRSASLVGLLALACVGLIIHHGTAGQPRHPRGARASAETATVPAPARLGHTFAQPEQRLFVHEPRSVLRDGSLRNTVADGHVTLDHAGQLKPDLGLRRLFDYYLSLNGETDLAGIRKLLHHDVCGRALAVPVVDQVMLIFDRYVRYQQAAVARARQPGSSLADAFAQLATLRQQMLGERVAEAFYGAEQSRQNALLARLQVAASRDLSSAQKAARLQSLEASRPPDERQARAHAAIGQLVQQQTELFDESGADAATRHAERAQVWGDQAADRLAQLDRRRAQWAARLHAYSVRSQAIERDASLDDAARQSALLALLQTSFNDPEQRQVQALARNGLLAADAD